MYIEEEETILDKEVSIGLNRLKVDSDCEAIGTFTVFSERDFGVCHDCKHLCAFKTQYGTTRGKCYEFDMWIRGVDTIKHCTKYDKKGQMTILEMKDMAYLIDIEKKTVGFF